MIAEIYNKVNRLNTNLSERLEDELTGNFFGCMRYIPYNDGLKKIFQQGIFPNELATTLVQTNKDEWDDNIFFWRRDPDEGEIDVCIEFDDVIIGIEVKLYSPLSYDNLDKDIYEVSDEAERFSKDQIKREIRMLYNWAPHKTKMMLLLADQNYCGEAYQKSLERGIDRDILFGYISWQSILEGLKCLNVTNSFHKVIINDLIELLRNKGLEKFQCFNMELGINVDEYWIFNGKTTNIFMFDKLTEIKEDLFYEFRC